MATMTFRDLACHAYDRIVLVWSSGAAAYGG